MVANPWSQVNPNLQLAWDATSFKALMFCPRYYQYVIKDGWRSPFNEHTAFGGMAADCFEHYKKARLDGLDKAEATLSTVEYAIVKSWEPDNGPLNGRYAEQWRCLGTEPYRNEGGNRAKCPSSLSGHWHEGSAPSVCGTCGSETHTECRWVSDNPSKDRPALIRMIVWWCDDQPEEGGVQVYAFPDGTPAVELSWSLPLPWQYGKETYLLAGHFDSIDTMGMEFFISDNKTTKNSLDMKYWAQYSPNVQVDIYDLAGTLLYPDLGIRGVRIDAAQTLVGGAHFGTRVFYRSDAQREELLQDLRYWLDQAEGFAERGHWPMNRASCYTCPFKKVCSKPEDTRERWLKADFIQQHWNPLEER